MEATVIKLTSKANGTTGVIVSCENIFYWIQTNENFKQTVGAMIDISKAVKLELVNEYEPRGREVLITSKTHKGHSACVGGLVLGYNQFVRLLNEDYWDQPSNTNLNIGDVWFIRFEEIDEVEPPHIEDVVIINRSYLRKIRDISAYIKNCGVEIVEGSPNQLFDGLLGWTGNGSGYIEDEENLPDNSVGFWIADKDLTLDEDGKHYRYPAVNTRNKRLPYVGYEPTVSIIPTGTLMRISLARWWSPEDSDVPERCYLQLSGWYGLDTE